MGVHFFLRVNCYWVRGPLSGFSALLSGRPFAIVAIYGEHIPGALL